MRVIGLTGSIGMGKSTTAAMFRDLGVPVYDADAAVHALYAPGGAAVPLVEAAFPGTTGEQGVDRVELSKRVTGDADALRRLEAIVHPLAAVQHERFLEQAEAAGADVAVFDIPLLFESGGDALVDAVVVVTADAAVQRERALSRAGMTEEKLTAILARQTPDDEKRRRADFVIETGDGLAAARDDAARVLAAVRAPDFKSRRARLDAVSEAGQ